MCVGGKWNGTSQTNDADDIDAAETSAAKSASRFSNTQAYTKNVCKLINITCPPLHTVSVRSVCCNFKCFLAQRKTINAKLNSDVGVSVNVSACVKTCCTEAFLYTHTYTNTIHDTFRCVCVCTKDFCCRFLYLFYFIILGVFAIFVNA